MKEIIDTYCNGRTNVRARYDAANEYGEPYSIYRSLESVEVHETVLQWKCVISSQRIEQSRAGRKSRDSSHSLRKRNDSQAHECKLSAYSIIVQLRDWNGISGRLDIWYALHREQEGKHIGHTNKVRPDNRSNNCERSKDFCLLCFLGELRRSLATFECIYCLKEVDTLYQ